MDAATAELNVLFEDRNRREQIDTVIRALKQLLEPSESIAPNQRLDPRLSVPAAA